MTWKRISDLDYPPHGIYLAGVYQIVTALRRNAVGWDVYGDGKHLMYCNTLADAKKWVECEEAKHDSHRHCGDA